MFPTISHLSAVASQALFSEKTRLGKRKLIMLKTFSLQTEDAHMHPVTRDSSIRIQEMRRGVH